MNNITINQMHSAVNAYFELEKAQEMFIRNEIPIDLEMVLLDQMMRAMEKLSLKAEVQNDQL